MMTELLETFIFTRNAIISSEENQDNIKPKSGKTSK